MVTTGKDKGKVGVVLRVFPRTNQAVVQSINVIKKAKRRTQKDQQAGFVNLEMPIHLSNLMLVDKKNNQPTRFKISIMKDGSKERLSVNSGEAI